MIRKYAILIGILIGLILLVVATFHYPGGSQHSIFTKGFDWEHNYLSNLLGPLSLNGLLNDARPYAIGGMLFITTSFGVFFVKFSNRIKIKSASFVIKYFGILATIMGFLTFVPSLHNKMLFISSILILLIFSLITILAIKSKLNWIKVMSIIFIIVLYFSGYMFFTESFLEYMPIMQKAILLMQIVWILSLEHLTHKEDFQ